jgi:hypothetical protein
VWDSIFLRALSQITLTPNDQLPIGQPLELHVGMYSLPTPTNPKTVGVMAIDAAGNPASGWITIPVCVRR